MSPRTNKEPLIFAQDIIWVGLSQIFASLLGIVTLPVLTKSYPPEMYGIWAQVSVTVGLFSPLLTLHLGTAAIRFLSGEDDAAKRSRNLGAMLLIIISAASVVAIVGNAFAPQLSRILFSNDAYTIFIRLTFFWAFIGAPFIFLIAYLRAKGQIKRLSIISSASGLSKMCGIIILARSGFGLEWIVSCMALVELCFVIGVLFMIIREEGFPRPNFSGMRHFLAFSIPQIPLTALLWIISASDRYFITHFLGLSYTGIYTSSHALGGLITFIYYPIGFVLLPAVSRAWEQGRPMEVRKYFEYSTKLFLTLAISAIAGITLLSQPLLKVLATSEYLVGWKLVMLVATGTMFLGIFLINLYIIYLVKQTKWLPAIVTLASGISAGLNLVLIPRIGIMGAAISNIAAYFVLAAIVTLWAKKVVSYHFDFRYLGKIVAATLVMSLCLRFLHVHSVAHIVMAAALGVFVFAIMLFLFRAFSEQEKRLIRQTLAGMVTLPRRSE